MPKEKRNRKYDYSGFFRGEPIKIDIAEHNSKSVEASVRHFLAIRGYPNPRIEKTFDTRPPFRAWLIADWQKPAKTTLEKMHEHPYYEFVQKGYGKLRPENWQTMEQAHSAFCRYIKKLGYKKRLFVMYKREDLRGQFWDVTWLNHPRMTGADKIPEPFSESC